MLLCQEFDSERTWKPNRGPIPNRRVGGRFAAVQVAALLLCVVAGYWVIGCGPQARPEAPVLMICIDGMEMSVVHPMLARGELPHMAKLIDRGVCGQMRTVAPAESPVVWTSIATGKTRERHEISGFTDPRTGGPFTSNARRGKAFWNIADDYGLSCNLVGYWITWPAEEVRGTVVSQFSAESQMQAQKMKKGTLFKDLDDATWPPELIDEIWPLVEQTVEPQKMIAEVVTPVFGDLAALQLPMRIQELISSSYWSFEADAVYHRAARHIFSNQPADINVVYYGGTDVIGHRFWRYREPQRYSYPIVDEYIRAFGRSIENYYQSVDAKIGELLDLFPENTRVFVMSDHGMHADFLDGTVDGKPTSISAHHLDGPPGLLIAAGQGISKGSGTKGLLQAAEIPEIASVYDIAPTLLYLLDLPVGRNMRFGRVLKDILTMDQRESRPVEFVESHDEGFRPPTPSESSEEADKEFIERFRKLGYI